MTRKTRSAECAKGCGGRTRHKSGVCQRCRPPEVVRVRELIEVVHPGGTLTLSAAGAIALADMLVDATENECE